MTNFLSLMRWTLNYSNTELILISLGIFALGSLLLFTCYKVIDVMIVHDGEDSE